ncbi:MAG: Phosphoribosylglycinamide formyltransferase [Candidatus Falkowbacteria bacterium GW2011_GWF2_39_8]|uniref:phosphoribosylglycinamide formyltransferase 1 n=1 Tax=Candidatus Falkowbacteria bacterium GW2011_GWF2_39_8 TaxID=1618642 RepID=A0A0G0PWK2_9BACT|nr:MAG: Phosphoribosylglycinamide formyltransferase [Candidatus Falkowbacteria bacterium GW2011_GWF2_39_8]
MIRQFLGKCGFKPLHLGIFISGSGTDMMAVLLAYLAGSFVGMFKITVVSTVEDAPGIEKARRNGVKVIVVARKGKKKEQFRQEVVRVIKEEGFDLVFLLGCLAYIPKVDGVEMFNIHPADKKKYGGMGWHGLKTHLHVLVDILDDIIHYGYDFQQRYETEIVVHRAHKDGVREGEDTSEEFDVGPAFVTQKVTIPHYMLQKIYDNREDLKLDPEKLLLPYADDLQKYVLRFEWGLLISAVQNAVTETIANLEGERYLEKLRAA